MPSVTLRPMMQVLLDLADVPTAASRCCSSTRAAQAGAVFRTLFSCYLASLSGETPNMPFRHAHWYMLSLFPLAALAFWPNYLSKFGKLGVRVSRPRRDRVAVAGACSRPKAGRSTMMPAPGIEARAGQLALFPLFLAGERERSSSAWRSAMSKPPRPSTPCMRRGSRGSTSSGSAGWPISTSRR